MGKLVKVEPSILDKALRPKTNNLQLLEGFMAMDVTCVEYVGYTHKNAEVCRSSIYQSIKLYGFRNIGVLRRGDHIYLIRKDLIGKVKF